MCVCVFLCMCPCAVPLCSCGGQRTTDPFISSYTMWVPSPKFSLLDVTTSTFTCRAITGPTFLIFILIAILVWIFTN